MTKLATETQCDLCYKELVETKLPASLLNHIPDLNKMCGSCNDRLSAALTDARRYVHQYISVTLEDEALAIREENTP